jgi:hypothetical protein
MRSAKLDAFRQSSKPYSTCEGLRRQKGRVEAFRCKALNLCSVAVEAIDSPAMQNLEEEVKPASTDRELFCYAIQTHLIGQYSPTRRARLAA